jgi:hypothetical protein
MSQSSSQSDLAYYIYSNRLKEYSRYHLKGLRSNYEDAIFSIFDEETKNNIMNDMSFELGGEKLLKVKENLKIIIEKLLKQREDDSRIVPPNYVNKKILNSELVLNLRNKIDENIFWYGGIYYLIEDALTYNYSLRFIASDGFNPVFF